MKIALISSEVYPFSKTGGLADVVGALPLALKKLGAEVTVISPLYRSVRKHSLEQVPNLISVPLAGATAWGAMRRKGIFHFLEHDGFYDRPELYGEGDREYGDNAARFVFLMRGALEFLAQQKTPPDVIHVHDWQAGLVPLYVNTLYRGAFPKTRTVATIHNLAYQGRFWKGFLPVTGFGWDQFTLHSLEFHDGINFLKGALAHADALTTVSPTYARELQAADHGWGLDPLLRDRSNKLTGILNGVDYDEWSPDRDPHLAARYSAADLKGKAVCKAALQKRCGLPVRPDAPLFAWVGRLVEQKGVDLLLHAAEALSSEDAQFIVLGSGEARYQNGLGWFAHRYREKFSVQFSFDHAFSHQIIAGADALLMPSRYEPCGLTQMYALRYGTVPVVRSTGGLVDTVDPGVTGVRFDHFNGEGFLWAVRQAIRSYREGGPWVRMQRAGMAKDFSWNASAREYLRLFQSLMAR